MKTRFKQFYQNSRKFSFHSSSKVTQSEFEIKEFRNFNDASDENKLFLIRSIIPCFFWNFPSLEEFNVLIQRYFYSPIHQNTLLLIAKRQSSGEVVGFAIYNYFQMKLLPSDERIENQFIILI